MLAGAATEVVLLASEAVELTVALVQYVSNVIGFDAKEGYELTILRHDNTERKVN